MIQTNPAMGGSTTTFDPTAKRIVVADELGYCWGVRRAIDIITEAAEAEGPIAPVGDIIHNPQVVERLRAKGVEGRSRSSRQSSAGSRGLRSRPTAWDRIWPSRLTQATCNWSTRRAHW